MVEFFIMGG